MQTIYFDSEGLVESWEFYEEKELPYTLFFSISCVYPFVKFEEELKNINDYCFFILDQLKKKLKELIKDSPVPFKMAKGYPDNRAYLEENIEDIEDIEDIFDPAYMFSPVSTWEILTRDINKYTLLLLLLSYLESSLNEITKWFCEEQGIVLGRKEKGSNEITFYLERLGQCCQCDLTETLESELRYLDKVRKIRNQFVHREWDQVDKKYAEFRLCDVFQAVSMVFTRIEEAGCRIGLIERAHWQNT